MSNIITANSIKTKGITAFDKEINEEGEVFISVRGKNKFVVLSLDKYNYLRECELEAALMETRKDLENGNFQEGSIEDHLKRVSNG